MRAEQAAVADTASPVPGFLDRLGDRVQLTDRESGRVEVLRLRPELTASPLFEPAVTRRAEQLAGFHHPNCVKVRQIGRLPAPDGRLVVVSDAVDGWRLSEVLEAAGPCGVAFHPNAVLFLLRQLLDAVVSLHEVAPGISHGALGTERLIITRDGRLVVTESVLGGALWHLPPMPPDRLWRDLRLAVADSEARPFGRRTDLRQIGIVALSLALGRQLRRDEYPTRLAGLMYEWTPATSGLNADAFGGMLLGWLLRVLSLTDDLTPWSVAEARHALSTAVERHAHCSFEPTGLSEMLRAVADYYAAAVEAPDAVLEPPAAPAPIHVRAPEPVKVLPAEPVKVLPPEPVRVHAPAPVQAHAPEPAPVRTPEPVKVLPAEPVKVLPAEPLRVHAPAPVQAHAPEPAPVRTPEPVKVLPAEPVKVLPPEPVRVHAPAPVQAHAPEPAPVRAPEPVKVPPVEPVKVLPPEPVLAHSPVGPIDEHLSSADHAEERLQPGSHTHERQTWAVPAPVVAMKTEPAGQVFLAKGGSKGTAAVVSPLADTIAPEWPDADISQSGGRRRQTHAAVGLSSSRSFLGVDEGEDGHVLVEAPPRTRARALIGIGAAAVIILALGGYALVQPSAVSALATRRASSAPPPAVAGSASLTPANPAAPAPRVEAQRAPSTPRTPEAPPAAAAPEDPAPAGAVEVVSPVSLKVSEGGRPLGASGERIQLSVGRHTLEIGREDLGYQVVQVVDIKPGRPQRIQPSLPTGVANLNATPWAEVWIDGRKVGETPLGHVQLTIGSHEVQFRHPELGDQTRTLVVTTGSVALLSVELKK
jgi:hypothetical protein